MNIPIDTITNLLAPFAICFTNPSFVNLQVLFTGAVLAFDKRTVTDVLRAAHPLVNKSHDAYHQFFNRASWDTSKASTVLLEMVVSLILEKSALIFDVDDTLVRRKGPKVYAKGSYRDAVTSSQKHVNFSFGNKWVVVALILKLPFLATLALPVLHALYTKEKKEKENKNHKTETKKTKRKKKGGKEKKKKNKTKTKTEEKKESKKKRHKTMIDLTRGLMTIIKRLYPKRKIILLGDGGYGSLEFSYWCSVHIHALISRFPKDAALFNHPVKKPQGRAPVKGSRIPSCRFPI